LSKWRKAAKIDKNQPLIVEALRKIPGITVETGKDDILVGRNGVTYWFEIKSDCATNKAGTVRESAKKDSQKKLEATWTGHYAIVSSLDEILRIIGLEVSE